MDDKPVFDYEKATKAVGEVCDLMNALELTLFERFYVAHSISVGASGLLGLKYAELAEMVRDKADSGQKK